MSTSRTDGSGGGLDAPISSFNARANASPPRREGHASSGRFETTRTSSSTRSTPRTRTRHMTPSATRCAPNFAGAVTARPSARAPERDGSGSRFSSSSRSQQQSSRGDRDRVNVSRPCHGSEWRSRQPSECSGASARWTWSSERAPTRLRRASDSQWRAYRQALSRRGADLR